MSITKIPSLLFKSSILPKCKPSSILFSNISNKSLVLNKQQNLILLKCDKNGKSYYYKFGEHKKLALVIFTSTALTGGLFYFLNNDNDRAVQLQNKSLASPYNILSNENIFSFIQETLVDLFSYMFETRSLLAKQVPQQEKTILITPRQKLFFQFASVEYQGIPYMTPQDFLESVTENHPRPRLRRKILTKENYESYLKHTPTRKYGSSKLFRNLEDRGIINYSEYLFLLCVITKSKSRFHIAFKMFDTDGNDQVDKKEFLVLESVLNAEKQDQEQNTVAKIFQRESEPNPPGQEKDALKTGTNKLIDSLKVQEKDDAKKSSKKAEGDEIDPGSHLDTTLLVHFFGAKGNNVLKFDDFKKFMEDLQREVLEIEFNEFSKGMNKISQMEFAEIILRYTDFDREKKIKMIRRLQTEAEAYTRGITFDEFLKFSNFMNNLEDFGLALKFHTHANKSISKTEFQRAVKISSGFMLDTQIVDTIFKIFDEDGDEQLSFKEFIAVLKDRLRRGLKKKSRQLYQLNSYSNDLFENANLNSESDMFKVDDDEPTFLQKFKACLKKKMREKNYE